MRLALFPLARSTFDLTLADKVFAQKLEVIEQLEADLFYPDNILLDEEDTQEFIQYVQTLDFEAILILQLTFRDAETVCKIGSIFNHPITIWSTNEPRGGERLRLNSFCGLNLASHALGLRNRDFNWLYKNPVETSKENLLSALNGETRFQRQYRPESSSKSQSIQKQNELSTGFKIGLLGQHPPGFDTCKFDKQTLKNVFDTEVCQYSLDELFKSAELVPNDKVNAIREEISEVRELETVNQVELDKSLKLKSALVNIQEENSLDAFAIRCWPETFTEYGAAVCGPVSLMSEKKVPCACEADVMGALSQLYLQKIAHKPTFLVDIVDMDIVDNTGVVWHCGQAPFSMCDSSYQIEATVHTNRIKPLLFQFPLKEGEITLFRITQSLGRLRVVMTSGEVLDRPMAYTGTSGVIKFDNGVAKVLEGLIEERIEHHLVLAYGNYSDEIQNFASDHKLAMVEL